MATRKRSFGAMSSLGDGDDSYETATDVSRFLLEEKRMDGQRQRERERERERERLFDFAVAEPSPGPNRGTGDTPCVKRARLSKSCE